MTLAELAATFGPTAGFLIYLYLNRKPADDRGDDALTELRSIKEMLIYIKAVLDQRK